MWVPRTLCRDGSLVKHHRTLRFVNVVPELSVRLLPSMQVSTFAALVFAAAAVAAAATVVIQAAPAPSEPVVVFSFNESTTYPCIRIPAITMTDQGTLLAFAECRFWIGDGCVPVHHVRTLSVSSPVLSIDVPRQCRRCARS
jgi:hypothetical protein